MIWPILSIIALGLALLWVSWWVLHLETRIDDLEDLINDMLCDLEKLEERKVNVTASWPTIKEKS